MRRWMRTSSQSTWWACLLAGVLWTWSICRTHAASLAPAGVQLLLAHLIAALVLHLWHAKDGTPAQPFFGEGDGFRDSGLRRNPRARPGQDGQRTTLRRYHRDTHPAASMKTTHGALVSTNVDRTLTLIARGGALAAVHYLQMLALHRMPYPYLFVMAVCLGETWQANVWARLWYFQKNSGRIDRVYPSQLLLVLLIFVPLLLSVREAETGLALFCLLLASFLRFVLRRTPHAAATTSMTTSSSSFPNATDASSSSDTDTDASAGASLWQSTKQGQAIACQQQRRMLWIAAAWLSPVAFVELLTSPAQSLRALGGGRQALAITTFLLPGILLHRAWSVASIGHHHQRPSHAAMIGPGTFLIMLLFAVFYPNDDKDDDDNRVTGKIGQTLLVLLATYLLDHFLQKTPHARSYLLFALPVDGDAYTRKKSLPTSSLVDPLETSLSSSVAANLHRAVQQLDPTAQRMLLFLILQVGYMLVQAINGWSMNSLGLLSDAAHMLIDSFGIVLGLAASVIARLPPTTEYPYGFGRIVPYAGFFNAIMLVIMALSIVYHSISRLIWPAPLKPDWMLDIAAGGFLVNLLGIVIIHGPPPSSSSSAAKATAAASNALNTGDKDGKGHRFWGIALSEIKRFWQDLFAATSLDANERGVLLHVLADALGSIGVIVSSLCILLFEWYWTDPLASFVIGGLILVSVGPLLRDTYRLLCKQPRGKLPAMQLDIANRLLALDGGSGGTGSQQQQKAGRPSSVGWVKIEQWTEQQFHLYVHLHFPPDVPHSQRQAFTDRAYPLLTSFTFQDAPTDRHGHHHHHHHGHHHGHGDHHHPHPHQIGRESGSTMRRVVHLSSEDEGDLCETCLTHVVYKRRFH